MQKTNKKRIKVWKQIGSICITLLTVFSTAVTLINGLEGAINKFSIVLGPILSKIFVFANFFVFLPFGIVVIAIYIASYVTWKYRKDIGTHNIPCTLTGVFHFKIANRNNKLLKSIHKNLYHSFYRLKEDMHTCRIQSIEEVNKCIEDLLYDIHMAILKSFGLDLTISVKRLIMDRDNNLCLVPFIHFRNLAERNRSNPRVFNYRYYIEPEEYIDLPRYAEKARQYCLQHSMNRRYEVNNIFTYLITKHRRYWMSNNLKFDEDAEEFYTSSDNYPNCYKSMAVFSITPPERDVIPEGLIIFDTGKKGLFSEEECVQLFGYIAHLFYELIIEYNRYESKKK